MTDKLREALKAAFAEPLNCESVEIDLHGQPITCKGEGEFVRRSEVERVVAEIQHRIRAALAAAPQPAPVDREALVEVIMESSYLPPEEAGPLADDLLARGLRLPAPANVVRRDPVEAGARLAERFRPSLEILADGPAPETMAWAVVGGDGAIIPGSVWPEWEDALPHTYREGARAVRVAIRVVEGGDDASLDRIRALVKEADEKGLWRTETIKMPKRVVEGGDE